MRSYHHNCSSLLLNNNNNDKTTNQMSDAASAIMTQFDSLIDTIVRTSHIEELNQSFLQMHRLLNRLTLANDNNVDDGMLDELNQKFSEYCSRADKVYTGYIGRCYLNMYRNRWSAAKNDALTLQLIDNLGGVKKGGTGITDYRVLAIAFHMLFRIHKHEGEVELLKYCIDGSHANEPLFVFTNLQKAQWYMDTQNMDIEENRLEVSSLLNDIVERCPELDEAFFVRSLYYKNVVLDHDAALRDIQTVLQLNPNHQQAKDLQ